MVLDKLVVDFCGLFFRYMAETLMTMMKTTVDKSDTERENVMELINALKSESLVSSDHFMEVRIRIDMFHL